jgi:hypothetical protein
VTHLQNLSDDEFLELVKLHSTSLAGVLNALAEMRLVGEMLSREATRRAHRTAAVPAQVQAELRAILDKSW